MIMAGIILLRKSSITGLIKRVLARHGWRMQTFQINARDFQIYFNYPSEHFTAVTVSSDRMPYQISQGTMHLGSETNDTAAVVEIETPGDGIRGMTK